MTSDTHRRPDFAAYIVEALLGDAKPGDEVAAGYTLETITCSRTIDLAFQKAGAAFGVWLKSPKEESGCYLQTARFRLGYTGEPPDPEGFRLLEWLSARIRENEAGLSDEAYGRLFLEPGSTGDLVLSGGDCLELRVTLKCNEECPFCNTVDYAENVVRDPAALRAAVARAPDMGAKNLILTGGEPTLVKGLPDVVKQARSLGLKVVVQTNGLACATRGYWDRFEVLPDTLFVSFHTRDPRRLKAITGLSGTLDRKVGAVKTAMKLGMDVVLNFVVTTLNMDELGDFPSFAARIFGLGVSLELSIVAPNERAAENFHLVPRASEVAPHLERALTSARGLGIHAEVPEVCGIPQCLLPHLRQSFVAYLRTEDVGPLARDHVKAESCGNCAFDRRCIGVWRRYVDAHGFDEFKPVER
ncbi:MAG: radical SAM protein [Deltaproteobacteria bacterium]|nr:radical SAM protein [Deltaproteobacteria bacterium]